MFVRDNGPVGAINGLVIKVIYLCIEANSLRKANNLRKWKFKVRYCTPQFDQQEKLYLSPPYTTIPETNI